ncbi:hypothetical protein HK104_003656 [Borealophlyctis nickersoniae]|nr:hypothetical protein HK104_003656 [Borealophlyctis nickersoniae]
MVMRKKAEDIVEALMSAEASLLGSRDWVKAVDEDHEALCKRNDSPENVKIMPVESIGCDVQIDACGEQGVPDEQRYDEEEAAKVVVDRRARSTPGGKRVPV